MRNMIRGIRRGTFVVAGLAVAAGAMISAKPASATPATLGFYPATDIYGKGNFHYDADAYTTDDLDNSVFVSSGLTYGIGPDTDKAFGRTEVGIDYNLTSGATQFDGSAQDVGQRLFFNVKTQLYNDDKSGTRIVIGGWGLGDKDANPNYVYLLGSKSFEFGRIHLGVARGLSKRIITDDRTSLHLGYDKYLTPKIQFAVDYYTGKNAVAGVQPTLYYYINDKANFGLGWYRTNLDIGDNRNQIYMCFDYNFDFATKK